MKLEKWFLGILTIWIVSLPFERIFREGVGATMNPNGKMVPWVRSIWDFLEVTHLGLPALLIMLVAWAISLVAPLIVVPLFVFLLFKYAIRAVQPYKNALSTNSGNATKVDDGASHLDRSLASVSDSSRQSPPPE